MNKQEFKATANKTIDEISARINELKADKASAQNDLKGKIDTIINDLKIKETELKDRLIDIENTSEEEWEKAKEAFIHAKEGYNTMLSEIESKLEKAF